MNPTLTGCCTCGAVHFSSQAEPVVQLICHCTDCQEATGAAFARTAFFRTKTCQIVGDLVVRRFVAASGHATTRESCSKCHALMFDRSEGFPTLVGVMADRLNAPFMFRPACHVWTRSQRADSEITDGLPQYKENMTA